MWSRIWCKTIQNTRNTSSSFLHHILSVFHNHKHYLALHRAFTHLPSSGSLDFKSCCSLLKVFDSWHICIWIPSKHPQVSSDTIYCHAPHPAFRNPNVHSHRYSLCIDHKTALGFRGASLAVSISLWISTLVLAIYVIYSKKFKKTWEGFSSESLRHIGVNLRLALPSAAMVW